MRKASREVRDFSVITDIISECNTLHLGMISEGEPYVVPLSFGFDADPENEKLVIYLHGAPEGKKIDALKANPKVSFSMVSNFIYTTDGPACTNPSYYRSVLGKGTVSFIDSPEEKLHALKTVIKQVSGDTAPTFAPHGFDNVCVYRIDVTEVTGKQNLPKEKSDAAKPVSIPEHVTAYVDGSYDSASNRFSYGCVILDGDNILATLSKAFNDPELATMHNVAGEIKGAEAAMQYCLDNGIKAVTVYHDYEGIAKWPLRLWKANKEGTIAYRDFFDAASKSVSIDFVKVKGHSGVKYNEMSDKLAGSALI